MKKPRPAKSTKSKRGPPRKKASPFRKSSTNVPDQQPPETSKPPFPSKVRGPNDSNGKTLLAQLRKIFDDLILRLASTVSANCWILFLLCLDLLFGGLAFEISFEHHPVSKVVAIFLSILSGIGTVVEAMEQTGLTVK